MFFNRFNVALFLLASVRTWALPISLVEFKLPENKRIIIVADIHTNEDKKTPEREAYRRLLKKIKKTDPSSYFIFESAGDSTREELDKVGGFLGLSAFDTCSIDQSHSEYADFRNRKFYLTQSVLEQVFNVLVSNPNPEELNQMLLIKDLSDYFTLGEYISFISERLNCLQKYNHQLKKRLVSDVEKEEKIYTNFIENLENIAQSFGLDKKIHHLVIEARLKKMITVEILIKNSMQYLYFYALDSVVMNKVYQALGSHNTVVVVIGAAHARVIAHAIEAVYGIVGAGPRWQAVKESKDLCMLPILPISEALSLFKYTTNTCWVCANDGLKKCSICKEASYCSRECQTIHWPQHKLSCKKQQN
jgi:hypothetical protein